MDIVNLENINSDFGGKANGLARLLKIGVPVPKGFVISNNIINKIISNNKNEIIKLSEFLGGLSNKLAVRSSALNEDGAKKSFAGIFDTILNVNNNLSDVLDAIRKVAGSVNKVFVESYNNENNQMNIIVQEMVDPNISGVAFTEATNYNKETVLLIEYVTGTADKLVSGNVTPSRIILNYDKNKNIIYSKKAKINILIPYLEKIINEFKIPTDIEWCIDKNNKPYFVQARPITQKVLINNFLEKTNFWFKEFRTPLFYSTNPNNKIYQTDVILLFKSNSTYAYNLNEKEVKKAIVGYRTFTNSNKLKIYEEKVNKIKKILDKTKKDYQNAENLSNKDFKTNFFKFLKLLNDVGNVYNKTEPYMLSKIEKNKLKYDSLIKKISKIRWELRKEVESIYYFLYSVFLRELSRRYKVKLMDLNLYTFSELNNLFNGEKLDENIINVRKKGFALICDNRQKIILVNEDFKSLFKMITQSKELTGTIVVPGNLKGIARVIRHNKGNLLKENNEFKRGEILVTEMTRPDTIIACKKAGAILTDEGGLTSHAAIIARELKIPCVVGLKNATNLIKTGNSIKIENGNIQILTVKNHKK